MQRRCGRRTDFAFEQRRDQRSARSQLNDRLFIGRYRSDQARINLAYAPEIAAVMLRRQQADAIISAREKIVEAVTMVKMALDRLADDRIVSWTRSARRCWWYNLW